MLSAGRTALELIRQLLWIVRVVSSFEERLQEVLCIQTACHEPRSLIDHHRQNFFAALVDDGNLVEIDDTLA
jgi:hypothetical protein